MLKILEKLKAFPKDRTLLIVTILTFIPFLALTIVFCLNELRLISSIGYGVLDFELAWSPDTINAIFTAWGSEKIQQQTFITYIDYIFIPCYGLFGAECLLIATRKLKGKLLEIGLVMTLTTIIAGLFDAIENINLLVMLNDPFSISTWNPFFASLCASFKIGFIGAGLGFLYVASVVLIIRKMNLSALHLYLALIGGGLAIFCLLLVWSLFISILIGATYFGLLFLIIWRLKDELLGNVS